MKKLIKNLILFLVLTICQSAFCCTLSDKEISEIILNKINFETKKYLGDIEYKIKIHGILSDVSSPDSNKLEVDVPLLSEFNPISYRRITVKDLQGNILRTFPLNIQILVYQDVLVASDNIGFAKSIDNSNTKLERKEVSKILDNVIVSLPEDYIASKNIIKGNIIQKNSIKKKAIITKNQNIDIVFQGKGVQIAVKGKALKEGALGDTILVRSDKYNKTYSAIIDSDSKVTVRI